MRSLTVDYALDVPMSDGTILVADVFRPSGDSSLPTVVVRTPYNRQTPASRSLQVDAIGLATAGYAVVIQDTRGRFASGGSFVPFVDESLDGYDTIHWCADQPWSNGRVAMAGNSYLGFCQIAGAAARPEPLEAILPSLTVCDVRDGWIREGGEPNAGFNMAWLLAALLPHDPRIADRDAVLRAHTQPLAALRPDSEAAALIAASPLAQVWSEWSSSLDPYPEIERVPSRATVEGLDLPALVIAGWCDIFQPSNLELYEALGPTASLMVGPWGHGGLPLARRQGQRDHGAAAAVDMPAIQRSFLDRNLRDTDGDKSPGSDRLDNRVFITGANVWETFPTWPASGRATTLYPDHGGGLTDTPSTGSVEVRLDPLDPTPAVGGRVFPWEPIMVPGPFDQTARDNRADVCCFTSAPLDAPLLVAGPVHLTISSADPDGGLMFATLSDVEPGGPAWNVADGVAAVTGSPTMVSLGHAAHRFAAGHQIRVSVSFGAYPRFRWLPGSGHRQLELGPITKLELWTA